MGICVGSGPHLGLGLGFVERESTELRCEWGFNSTAKGRKGLPNAFSPSPFCVLVLGRSVLDLVTSVRVRIYKGRKPRSPG